MHTSPLLSQFLLLFPPSAPSPLLTYILPPTTFVHVPLHPHILPTSSIPCSLNDLEQFIKLTSGGLYMTVEEGDYDGLVGVMGHLMQVKGRQPAADHMFEPLKETIELLTAYGQELPDAVHQQLQVCLLARTVKRLL